MAELDEGGTGYLTATFRDKDGVAAQPTSSYYAIHDSDTEKVIRASTALSPTSGVVEITLDKTDNTMNDPAKDTEGRKVIVVGVFGAADEVTKVYKYRLNNLEHAPLAAP